MHGVELEILWEFDDIRQADKSLCKAMKSGSYDRAIGMLEDLRFSRFNDYLEDLNGSLMQILRSTEELILDRS